MIAPTPAFEPGTVVVLPFPFTDRASTKRRPALVVSSAAFNGEAGHFVAAMITSDGNDPWPEDVPITRLESAGLLHASVVRMKLFTLDARLVLRAAGALAATDWAAVCQALSTVLPALSSPAGGSLHEPLARFG